MYWKQPPAIRILQLLRLSFGRGDFTPLHGCRAVLVRYKVARVTRVACAAHARRLGLGGLLVTQMGFRTNDGSTKPQDSMLAEAFEAVMGALYLVMHASPPPPPPPPGTSQEISIEFQLFVYTTTEHELCALL